MDKKLNSLNLSVEVEEQELSKEVELLLTQLPKAPNMNGGELCQYQGFWIQSRFLHGMISFQRQFKAQESDIILTSFPKSGTTWLKALAFTIVNRSQYTLENSPLLIKGPHELVPFLEMDIYRRDQPPMLDDFSKPRIFATHTPYTSLPNSIKNSDCRIVYICRNPLDQFISHWKWLAKFRGQNKKALSLDEAFELVCLGIQGFGPILEHVLGYWKASKEEPHKILFLKYEDLKEDINFYVKRLADFLGFPFTEDEERQGVTKEISKFCSFDKMKDLEVTWTGKHPRGYNNDIFFRKGLVGDWKYCLTTSMSEHLEKLVEDKLRGSGLTFNKP